MAEPNVRARGKIPREEWSRIVDRFHSGETLAELARRYKCTAPAIRYIVQRSERLAPGGASQATIIEQDNRRMDPVGEPNREQDEIRTRRDPGSSPLGHEIWKRINTDIAAFLAAVDDLFVTESDGNYEALLDATDRLLRASARTRLELERVIAGRRTTMPRRRPAL